MGLIVCNATDTNLWASICPRHPEGEHDFDEKGQCRNCPWPF